MSAAGASGDRHHVVLSIGANLGDAVASVRSSVDAIDADPLTNLVGRSSLYSTAPIGGPEQADYVNAVIVVLTDRSPHGVLELAHSVEAAHDRVREVRWGPRTLDIDVIAYDDLVLDDPDLTLPHPRAHERAFVLVPWAEVEPQARLVGRGRVRDLAAQVSDQQVRRLDDAGMPS